MSCCQTVTVHIMSCLCNHKYEHKASDIKNNIVDNNSCQISRFHLFNQFTDYASSIIEILISCHTYLSDLSNT